MNREIRFRAWDKRAKEIKFDQEFIPIMVTSAGVFRLDAQIEENRWMLMPADRFELMQSTGQEDEEGAMSYEGDLVADPYTDDEGNKQFSYHPIVWDDKSLCWALDVSRKKDMSSLEPLGEWDSFFVAGNIYQNPELTTK